MSKTLTQEDIKAIGKEVSLVLEKCLKNFNQMEVTKTDELMNVDELSEKLKLSKQSVYSLIKKESIVSIKIGKQIYCKKSDFNKYLETKFNPSF